MGEQKSAYEPGARLLGAQVLEIMTNSVSAATVETVLNMLRQLPSRERLKVIAQALPEAERELSQQPRRLKSLRGLWKDLNFDLSAEDMDQARREAWASFPREDI